MGSEVERIEAGMTTVEDADVVVRLIDRLMRYEMALRRIAVHGGGSAAMLACRVLAGDWDEPEQ